MTEDEFITWLATQRGTFTLYGFNQRIRAEDNGKFLSGCPLQLLTGSAFYYMDAAVIRFGLPRRLCERITDAADNNTMNIDKRLRARMLDALGLS